MPKAMSAEVIIVGGGLAGLSAAIYLGRANRDAVLVDSGKSMARWEPDIQNYLGFPEGIDGKDLLRRGQRQARRYGVRFCRDEIIKAGRLKNRFALFSNRSHYECERLLVCTGAYHVPPEIPGITKCLGHSMFFCKDCDGFRVRGKTIGVYGWRNETVRYALGMLLYSHCVAVFTDGRVPNWDARHARWLKEYKIPIYSRTIVEAEQGRRHLRLLRLAGGAEVHLEALFITRGDIFFNKLAKDLGAQVDEEDQIVVDLDMRTSIRGLYAAGCVTPANCQMIIAAGQGATAAQAINRDLLEQSVQTRSLHKVRRHQLQTRPSRPAVRLPGRRPRP
ncbi:MAG TPA: NAD(P)/FAD-dependent oxidoreductase [Verrucomicrobiae bacterium]|nr:NAD(P)/FAD-dependent oxidoreductase [Verrucomicrobiae bacterium]